MKSDESDVAELILHFMPPRGEKDPDPDSRITFLVEMTISQSSNGTKFIPKIVNPRPVGLEWIEFDFQPNISTNGIIWLRHHGELLRFQFVALIMRNRKNKKHTHSPIPQ
ncbi:MAG: hypothetical protein NTW50_02035 [Candidatus Berkelbacteria bacterium]|nr:hypothetical protein [Candidatus Berkelbacteria bacterium]